MACLAAREYVWQVKAAGYPCEVWQRAYGNQRVRGGYGFRFNVSSCKPERIPLSFTRTPSTIHKGAGLSFK
jgi:hypothetical protein